MKKYVLSLSGGGCKGIISLLILNEICKRLKKHPTEIFDLFIGTSTGGIISLLLNSPDKNSIENVIELYTGKDIKTIFKPKLFKNPLDAVKYPSNQIEGVLKNRLKEYTLKDCIKPVVVTTYDTNTRNSIFINSIEGKYKNFKMWECARATSSAPTYFQPFSLSSMSCTDGGLFANNPALFGYVEAKKMFPNDEIILISLGTGSSNTSITHKELIKWNVLQWACNLFDIVSDGQSDTVEYSLTKLLGENYFCFNFDLPKNMDKMDDASDKFIYNLICLTKDYIKNEGKKEIDRLITVI